MQPPQLIHVSLLGYSHRLVGVSDPAKVFFIGKILKGYGKLARALTQIYLSHYIFSTKLCRSLPLYHAPYIKVACLKQRAQFHSADFCE